MPGNAMADPIEAAVPTSAVERAAVVDTKAETEPSKGGRSDAAQIHTLPRWHDRNSEAGRHEEDHMWQFHSHTAKTDPAPLQPQQRSASDGCSKDTHPSSLA